MLGKGRPFILQLVNPKKRHTVTVDELRIIEANINKSTACNVLNLDFGDEKNFLDLKDSEETKVKVYCCLVETSEQLTPEIIKKINESGELHLDQKTPLRVLHRRSNKIRDKVIHRIHVHPVMDYISLVFVFASAGTYIKEFIHGDLGRYSSSLLELFLTLERYVTARLISTS